MAEPRLTVAHDILWVSLKDQLRELLGAYQMGVLNAGGDDLYSFAREALTAQGRWLALQDVLALISELEEAERTNTLGQEDADAPHGRGSRRAEARHR